MNPLRSEWKQTRQILNRGANLIEHDFENKAPFNEGPLRSLSHSYEQYHKLLFKGKAISRGVLSAGLAVSAGVEAWLYSPEMLDMLNIQYSQFMVPSSEAAHITAGISGIVGVLGYAAGRFVKHRAEQMVDEVERLLGQSQGGLAWAANQIGSLTSGITEKREGPLEYRVERFAQDVGSLVGNGKSQNPDDLTFTQLYADRLGISDGNEQGVTEEQPPYQSPTATDTPVQGTERLEERVGQEGSERITVSPTIEVSPRIQVNPTVRVDSDGDDPLTDNGPSNIYAPETQKGATLVGSDSTVFGQQVEGAFDQFLDQNVSPGIANLTQGDILFTSSSKDEGSKIRILDLKNYDIAEVDEGHSAEWTRDHKRVFYFKDDGLYVRDANNARRLARTDSIPYPDTLLCLDDYIIYGGMGNGDGNFYLYRLDIDGSSPPSLLTTISSSNMPTVGSAYHNSFLLQERVGDVDLLINAEDSTEVDLREMLYTRVKAMIGPGEEDLSGRINSISPSRDMIVYNAGIHGAYLLKMEQGKKSRFRKEQNGKYGFFRKFRKDIRVGGSVWSPDGSSLAIVDTAPRISYRNNGNPLLVQELGPNTRGLTPVPYTMFYRGLENTLAWHPDSTHFVFAFREVKNNHVASKLILYNRDNRTANPILEIDGGISKVRF
jgi:hypothetical protein